MGARLADRDLTFSVSSITLSHEPGGACQPRWAARDRGGDVGWATTSRGCERCAGNSRDHKLIVVFAAQGRVKCLMDTFGYAWLLIINTQSNYVEIHQ